ncbi:MAG TPA: hypothetical protein VH369_11590 [Bryobacteraceae bacterium]|jgi:hypothetical protein
MPKIGYLSIVLLAATGLSARDELSDDRIKLLQDPGGWEYIKIEDSDAGIQTEHTCFDGTPHPDVCSGTLTLSEENTFVQQVTVHHQSVSRHGTYTLEGDQLAFFDEFGTKDGPYAVSIDPEKTSLSLRMPQVHMDLLLKNRKKRK